jgi:hypothetical protein
VKPTKSDKESEPKPPNFNQSLATILPDLHLDSNTSAESLSGEEINKKKSTADEDLAKNETNTSSHEISIDVKPTKSDKESEPKPPNFNQSLAAILPELHLDSDTSVESKASALLTCVLGKDFDRYNAECEFIDKPSEHHRPNAIIDFLKSNYGKDEKSVGALNYITENPDNNSYVMAIDRNASMLFNNGCDVISNHPYTSDSNARFVNVPWDLTEIVHGDGCTQYVCSAIEYFPGNNDEDDGKVFQAYGDIICEKMNGKVLIINNQTACRMFEPDKLITQNASNLEVGTQISSDLSFGNFALSVYEFGPKKDFNKTIENTPHLLRINGWTDGEAPPNTTIYQMCQTTLQIANAYGAEHLIYHCNAGQGRSPSMLCYTSLTKIAMLAAKNNIPLCFHNDAKSQRKMIVDGKLNMSYVFRQILLNGSAVRSIFGWGLNQYNSFANYANFLANKTDIDDSPVN